MQGIRCSVAAEHAFHGCCCLTPASPAHQSIQRIANNTPTIDSLLLLLPFTLDARHSLLTIPIVTAALMLSRRASERASSEESGLRLRLCVCVSEERKGDSPLAPRR